MLAWGAASSLNALRAGLIWADTRDRGVKNRLNFLGVIDGFLRSLPVLRRGGESRSAWSLAAGELDNMT